MPLRPAGGGMRPLHHSVRDAFAASDGGRSMKGGLLLAASADLLYRSFAAASSGGDNGPRLSPRGRPGGNAPRRAPAPGAEMRGGPPGPATAALCFPAAEVLP